MSIAIVRILRPGAPHSECWLLAMTERDRGCDSGSWDGDVNWFTKLKDEASSRVFHGGLCFFVFDLGSRNPFRLVDSRDDIKMDSQDTVVR